jgi:protein O-mannosyl-transferase
LIESSFLNLELFYEHRNYIPSMLIFVPLAVGAVNSMAFFRSRRALQRMIGATLLVLLASNMQTTFVYNRTMMSQLSLWSHAAGCYPESSLAHTNLGKVYWNLGLFDASCRESRTAVELDHFNEKHQKGLAYYNLAVCAAYRKHKPALALRYLQTARSLYDDYPKIAFEIARCRMQMGEVSSAGAVLDKALGRWPGNPDLLGLQAVLDLKKGRCKEAVQAARRVIQDHPDDQMAWMTMAQGFRRMDEPQQALQSWQKLLAIHPDNIMAVMALMELEADLGQPAQACGQVGRFLELQEFKASLEAIAFSVKNRAIVPYTPDGRLIRQVLDACRSSGKTLDDARDR